MINGDLQVWYQKLLSLKKSNSVKIISQFHDCSILSTKRTNRGHEIRCFLSVTG